MSAIHPRNTGRRRANRLMRLMLVAVSSLALAACASVPGAGPVETGLQDLAQAERLVQYSASGPSAGDTQEQLVRGFLLAANASADNYSVAREFLTPAYAENWDPYDGVLVSEGTRPYRADGDNAGILSLALAAKVDAAGTLRPVEAGASTELRFEFEKQGNEWRISSAPSGLMIERPSFVTIWSSHQLYFLGAGGRLVPETRWFLSRTALATEVVTALLEGPSSRLEAVVHSGFPPGVKLAKSTVTVADGLARVDLTGEGLQDPGAQQEMFVQLQASLLSVPGILRVELLIDGTTIQQTSDIPSGPQIGIGTGKAAGIIDGKFGIVSAGQLEPVTDISAAVDRLNPSAVALARSKTVAGVMNDDGAYLVTNGEARLIDTRSGLLDPSADDDEWVWTTSASDPGTMMITHVDGRQTTILAPWLDGLDVRVIRISPGGSLIAALVTDQEKSYVIVGGVARDENGTPTGLTETGDIEMWASGEALDFDWVDQQRFVALTKQGSAGKVTVGGPSMFANEQGSVPNASKIAGGNSRAQIRVLSTEGDLFAPQGGSGWQQISTEVTLLAKRG